MNKKLIELMLLVYDYNEQNKRTNHSMKFTVSETGGSHSFEVMHFERITTYIKNDDGEFIVDCTSSKVDWVGQAFSHDSEYIQSAIDKVREMLEVE